MITMFLYDKPGHELGEGAPINADELRDLGNSIKDRLDWVAKIVSILKADGWEAQTSLYSVDVYKDGHKSVQDVKHNLRKLKLNPDEFDIFEEFFQEEEL